MNKYIIAGCMGAIGLGFILLLASLGVGSSGAMNAGSPPAKEAVSATPQPLPPGIAVDRNARPKPWSDPGDTPSPPQLPHSDTKPCSTLNSQPESTQRPGQSDNEVIQCGRSRPEAKRKG